MVFLYFTRQKPIPVDEPQSAYSKCHDTVFGEIWEEKPELGVWLNGLRWGVDISYPISFYKLRSAWSNTPDTVKTESDGRDPLQ